MAIRAKDLGLPKRIDDTAFSQLCEGFAIAAADRPALRDSLDKLVSAFTEWMKSAARQPSRKTDREVLEKAATNIDRAAYWLHRSFGPSGRLALAGIAPNLGAMLSSGWLRNTFPDDDLVPIARPIPIRSSIGRSIRTPMRAQRYDVEDLSLGERIEFVRRRSPETLAAMLEVMQKGLNETLVRQRRQREAKGGRGQLLYRHYLLMNLAQFWSDCGKPIKLSRKGDFVAFCEVVLELIGWPNDGIFDAVVDAVKQWRK